MIHRVVNYIQRHDEQLKEITRQRKIWTASSLISLFLIILVIFFWEYIPKKYNFSATIISLSLIIVSLVNWGFWTIRIFKKFMAIKNIEMDLIRSVVAIIKDLKNDLKSPSNLDSTNKK